MNNVNLIGRITKQPELRFAAGTGNAVTRFTIAVDRFAGKDKEKQTDFINCVVFGKKAETAAQTITKGTKIGISGSIKTGSYDGTDGSKRYTVDVIVDNYYYCEKKNQSNTADVNRSAENLTTVDDGDMPF